ncbi:MAG: hypothetical protein K1X51_11085 [Rhodospirillaceae bacterium]|nr:hypothetical protein [Rhodospirillaceae bacterium]
MSLQSIGNTLSLQQIMQLLQQQSLGAADPEAAAADQAGTPDPTGQNLPGDQPQAEEQAAPGAQLTPAKPTLDASTIKTLLDIQEAQTKASDDVLLFGNAGNSTGDPLRDALGGGQGQGQDPLAQVMGQIKAQQALQAAQPGLSTPDLSTMDAAQLQSVLAAMTGSAASGDAIASVTQNIMSLLESAGGGEATDGVGAVTAAEE